jgi:hypothetical protein
MNRKQEILTDYRLIVMELETLERQSKFLNKYIGGPKPLRGVQLTGMPRGTNDPEAAMLQQNEEDDPVFHIEELSKELGRMVNEFENIVNQITDRRLFIIVRNYYALGWTDEKIAENMDLSRQTVQKVRSDYFNSLA